MFDETDENVIHEMERTSGSSRVKTSGHVFCYSGLVI
jgi:hypothetical protein